MLYELPDGPEIHVVGPDDEAVWTALGVAAGDRRAVIIGAPAAPGQATVIVGTVADFAAWLDPVTGRIPAAQPTGGVGDEPTVVGVDADPPPVAELVTLPHTGIQVPDPTLRVSSLRQLPTPDGVAYTATLRQGRTPVGTIHNEGNGGATNYSPVAGSPFGPRELAAFVAASRTADGQPISDENLLEDWVTEFEHDKEVTAAVRLGRSPLRLRSPLSVVDTFYDEHFDDVYFTARHLTAAKVNTAADRAALTAELLRIPIEAGQWWQLWTGQQWEDLTPPPSRQPGSRQ
ncbi:hypothetical protein [Virgisporangium aurantiacum]|uniref:Uncharacterized protein n=1 Tax=Virgisporangium aurantiacum TaxID=175570 RepID=A0A8J4E5H1_9ACTN|nr:hypothetical protein [Virgisporangium aurantiacum]GIJ62083.1 hypothetical protein Vau01_095990 [Virgisporangium aurantiacum]